MKKLLTSLAILCLTISTFAGPHPRADFGRFGIQYSQALSGYLSYVGQTVEYLPAMKDGYPWLEDTFSFEHKGGYFNKKYTITKVSGSDSRVYFYLSPIGEGKRCKIVFDNQIVGDRFFTMVPPYCIPLLLSDVFEAYRASKLLTVIPEGNEDCAHLTIVDVFWGNQKEGYDHQYPSLLYKLKKSYDGSEVICSEEDFPMYQRLGEVVGGVYEIVEVMGFKSMISGLEIFGYYLRNKNTNKVIKCGKEQLGEFDQLGKEFTCRDSSVYTITDLQLPGYGSPLIYTLSNDRDNEEVILQAKYLSDVQEVGAILKKDAYDHVYKIVGVDRSDYGSKKYIVRNQSTGQRKTVSADDPIKEAFKTDAMISGYSFNPVSDKRVDKQNFSFSRSSKSLTSATGWCLDGDGSGKWISNQNFIMDEKKTQSAYWMSHGVQNFFSICTKEFQVGPYKFYALIVGTYHGDYNWSRYSDGAWHVRKNYNAYIFSEQEYSKLYDMTGAVTLKTELETYLLDSYSDAAMAAAITRYFESVVFKEHGDRFIPDHNEFRVRISSDNKVRFLLPYDSVIYRPNFNEKYFETTRENFDKILIRPLR